MSVPRGSRVQPKKLKISPLFLTFVFAVYLRRHLSLTYYLLTARGVAHLGSCATGRPPIACECDGGLMPGYGCDEDGGYNSLTGQYKENPSIERYVKLRREDPNAEIEISFLGGMEKLLFMQSELERFGFDPLLVASIMDADQDAISELSLQIMEKMIAGRTLSKSGKTHLSRRGLAVPDKLIDWLISCMLEGLSWNDDLRIPRDLIVLIRERLGGSHPEYEKIYEADEMRRHALNIGGQLMAQGRTPSFGMIGKILSVFPSTVMRWFPNGDFLQQVKKASSRFDESGKAKPFSDQMK